MRDIQIAAVQFESRNGDKRNNLDRIARLSGEATKAGAEVVSFHEACIGGYTWLQHLDRSELLDFAEPVPDGESVKRLMEISGDLGTVILAGLVERDEDGQIFNSYVCVDGSRLLARHRKIHAFINPALTNGNEYCVFDLRGVSCGILTCYDNNIQENVRITTLLGADVIFMPHVTCGLPSPMPGRGYIDPKLWSNRDRDPVRLRQEFMGPKARGWLMRWLPTRAYENGVYAVFTNPVGLDDGEVRNGNAMVIDPYGEIIAECNELGDGFVIGLCTPEKLEDAMGRRYLRARRPDLYDKLVEPSEEEPIIDSGWGITKKG